MSENDLVVGGITPFTTIDFPGRLAAVLFCQGCCFRCSFCHNTHLQPVVTDPETGTVPWAHILDFLNSRKGLLDGVVFSGGEPLVQNAVIDAAETISDMGYAVALHTSGGLSDRLEKLLPRVDWVGMDVKVPLDKYEKTPGLGRERDVARSLELLLMSDVGFEIRTTADPRTVTKADVLKIGRTLAELGVGRYVLQEYRPIGRVDEPGREEITAFFTDTDFITSLKQLFPAFEIRRA